jgi:phage-related protein
VATLFWSDPPQTAIMDEIAMYDMALTLENVTSGQAITLTLAMALDEQLEVDTENHTVTLLDDGSSQYQALERDTRRREMLPLLPGNNTLRVTEDGLAGVTIHVEFEERRYS